MDALNYLKKSWFAALKELTLGDSSLDKQIHQDLLNSYAEPTRYYHNLQHLTEMITSLNEVSQLTQDFPSLVLAAWFHDCIYHPQHKDNEQASAIYAEKKLTALKLEPEKISLISQLILSTHTHQPLLSNPDNLLFLDADLAILGTENQRYDQYAQAIRKEYQHLTDNDYYNRRIKILSQFLTRTRIYYSDYFYNHLESTARQNIQTEIEQLTKLTSP